MFSFVHFVNLIQIQRRQSAKAAEAPAQVAGVWAAFSVKLWRPGNSHFRQSLRKAFPKQMPLWPGLAWPLQAQSLTSRHPSHTDWFIIVCILSFRMRGELWPDVFLLMDHLHCCALWITSFHPLLHRYI